MRIGLSYDLKESLPVDEAGSDDTFEEYDSPVTVQIISDAIAAGGHEIVRLGGGREFLKNILREKVDFVFNIAEGHGNYRSREAQVPSVLEMLDIPYSGSNPQTLAICLDKPLTQQLVSAAGIRTPKWQLISSKQEGNRASTDFPFPAIIKPAFEGSSKGIRLSSVVDTAKQAKEEINKALELYRQPVMMEEFIVGDEVTVGIVGNSPPRIVGMMHIVPRNKVEYFVYSLEVKRDYVNQVDYECPARFEKKVLETIESYSLKAFQVLGCRDFARIDFRISQKGTPYFLEINPLPGLGTYSDLIIMAQKVGIAHKELIYSVFKSALERYPQCIKA